MAKPVCPTCGLALVQPAGGSTAFCPRCSPATSDAVETKTCAEGVPSVAPQDYRGRTFGNYTILEEISRGAMGVVYKARQHHLDRVVALKVLLAGELATESQVARFRREAQAAARLRHPAIVPIHEVGVFEGKHFYTMDYIKGRSLADLIRSGEVSIRRALDIAAQVADALEYAHSRGVVHRDIKPSNIMVDAEDRVHIMDFGLAKQLDSDTRFTRTGTTIGTPAYMPPEQASGESARVDHRADVYSLGAVLYEMLTSKPPFMGDTMMNTLMRVLNDEPTPPKRLNPRIHRDIQTIVLKAMEKSPERRYASMRAFADDIRRFIAGESISARPAGPLYRAWRFVRRHHTAILATAAVLAIGLTAAAVVIEARRESETRVLEAIEDGRRMAVQDLERKLEQQEQPTRKVVFEDDFARPDLLKRWAAEGPGSWRITPDGELEGTAGPLSSLRTLAAFGGNVTVSFEASVPPQADGAPQPEPLVGCFLGSDWRRSFRFSLGGKAAPRPCLVLMDPQQEVAEVACQPLRPGAWYRLTLRRHALGLSLEVQSDAEEAPLRLAYNDVGLARQLHRERRDFAVGLFAERALLRVRRFRVEQEFPPAKLSLPDAAEVLFRDGSTEEARLQFEKIAQGYEGRYEGLAALLGVARCHEAERRHRQAAAVLHRIEELAPKARDERLPALLARARLHRFFCSASLNDFADAVQALAQLAASGGEVDDAWLWQVPGYVALMLNNRAYDEALATLRAGLFAPKQQTLYAAARELQATGVDAFLAPRVRQLAEGFCANGRYEKVREVYDAWPTEGLADAFARAAEAATRRGQRDEALALLGFCSKEKLASPALSGAAVALANSFCEAGSHTRVARLYEVFREPKLAPVFLRAIRETTEAGRLDDALALARDTLASFPAEAAKLIGSDGAAVRLGRAFLARGELLKPIAIHSLFKPPPDDASLVALFVEAVKAAIAAGKSDEAVQLLDHARRHFGVLHPELAAAANRLAAAHLAAGAYDKVAEAYAAYPNEALAPTLSKAVVAAASAQRLRDALALLGHYARRRHAIPADAVQALADAIAASTAEGDERAALLEEYRRVYELYDSPVARSTFALALGDACTRAGRLREAAAQYEAAGDAEGLLRAACLAVELRAPERAAALARRLRQLAEADKARSAAAAVLLRETTPGDFKQAAAAAGLPPPLAHYLAGLCLWADADDRALEEFAQAAVPPPAWFTPLAKRSRGAEGPRE